MIYYKTKNGVMASELPSKNENVTEISEAEYSKYFSTTEDAPKTKDRTAVEVINDKVDANAKKLESVVADDAATPLSLLVESVRKSEKVFRSGASYPNIVNAVVKVFDANPDATPSEQYDLSLKELNL